MSKLAHSNQKTMDEIEAKAALAEGIDMDDEANIFAFNFLMPEKMLRADIKKLGGVDIDDESKIKKLARIYRVTNNVMVLRISQLSARRSY
jgi:Zn-dependent peptidase ImmA (M78 family)